MLQLLIRIIHLGILLFTILAPFSKVYLYISIHILLVPFLMIHWKLNNDTCALTEIEKLITREKNNSNTFIGSIIGPVYEPKSTQIQVISVILWCISLIQMYKIYF